MEETLVAHRQEHLLAGVDDLAPDVRARFLERLARIDWAELAQPAEPPAPGDVRPAAVVTLDDRARRRDANPYP